MNNARIEQLKKFIDEEPEDPFNVYALANEYISEQPLVALQYFEELLKVHPGYLGTYYQAGKLYQQAGNTEEAKKILQKGMELALQMKNPKILNELRNALNEILDEEL